MIERSIDARRTKALREMNETSSTSNFLSGADPTRALFRFFIQLLLATRSSHLAQTTMTKCRKCNVEQDEDGWCPECGGHTDVIVDTKSGSGEGSSPKATVVCCAIL